MTDWIDVTDEAALPAGAHEVVELNGTLVAVFNVDGDYLAVEDICTHDGEELTGGPLDGDRIVCPRHGATFCLRTGKALTPPAYEDIATFPVRVAGGTIQVRDPRDDP